MPPSATLYKGGGNRNGNGHGKPSRVRVAADRPQRGTDEDLQSFDCAQDKLQPAPEGKRPNENYTYIYIVWICLYYYLCSRISI